MSSEVELLPCPFCGSTDLGDQGPSFTQIMCNSCGAHEYDQPSREAAIAAWNRRVSASPSIGRVGVADVVREPAEERFKAAIGRYEEPWELADGLRESAFYWRDKPPSDYAAQPRIMADFHDRAAVALERLIALVYHEEPAGDTQGAGTVEDEAQPVAWRWTTWPHTDIDGDEWPWTITDKKSTIPSYATVEPLYAHPAALVSPPDNGEVAPRTEAELEALPAHPLAKWRGGLEMGLHRVHWIGGGSSLVAVGQMSDGRKWFAPCNWLAPSTDPEAYFWSDIVRTELLFAYPEPALQSHNEGSDGK